jgi:DNA polymerase III epsilon subunit-like protein
MTGQVTALLALTGAVLLLGLLVSLALGRRKRSAAARRHAQSAHHGQRGARPAVPAPVFRGSVATEARRPEVRIAVADPGSRGPLFQYGGDGPGFPVDAPYAVIHVETTGFSPAKGDRIVEIAIARVDARGRIEDEYATLVNPGRDVGPVFVHGISNSEVLDAPTFAEIAGELLARMDGAVVVAHNASFEERFLAAELGRMGVALPLNPALCSLWLARRTMRTPNHRLTTLARAAGLSTVDAHTALGDVRTVAALLPQMLATYGEPPRYLTGLRPMPVLDQNAGPKSRAVELHRGTDGWLASVIARLPAAAEAREADAQRYLDALTLALADGRIVGGEAQQLARLAGSAGLGAAQVEELHRRVLEHLRAATLQDVILTTAELRQLKTAASGLGLADYFDDLRATSPQDLLAARRS